MGTPEPTERRLCEIGNLRIEARGVTQRIRGHAIVFNRFSEVLGMFPFREQIAPEAVDRTLTEQIDLRALVDHDPGKVLGRLTAGTLRVEKDAHGLQIEIDPPATTAGQDIVESIRRRDVSGMSFAFEMIKNAWDESTDPPSRTILDMRVREVSIVTFPAYPQTDVALRSFQAARAARGPWPVTVAERLRWSQKRLAM